MTTARPDAAWGGGRLPAAFTDVTSSSFTDFLGAYAPDLLPGRRPLPTQGVVDAPHGTTIVAATFNGGVLMAGDRRATMGNVIAQRDIEKVFPADEMSCIGIAGHRGAGHRAGPAVPARARALRKDRGHNAFHRGQGQPPRRDGA